MEKNFSLDILGNLKLRLSGKSVILGIGNTLRSDDGVGSILASRIQDKVAGIVYDTGLAPENFLGKVIGDNPDTILLIDAVDFGGESGEFRVLEAQDLQTVNFFSTHDASINLSINYLKNSLKNTDIIILAIQPEVLVFGDKLSPQVSKTLRKLERWFLDG
ncbi:MAG: hydrogenase maturation protease [Candidatus Omnitrophota bacterium]